MSDRRRIPAPPDAIIASSVPGRVRLKLPAGRSADALAAVVEALESWPEVLEVQARARTGSVIVRYDTTATAGDALWAALDDAGVIRQQPGEASADRTPATAAQRIRAAASSANAAVERGAGGSDLRLLIPLALGMQSLRQAARGRHRLADAPWYLLAWYASETFMKFHAPPENAGAGGAERRRG